MSRLTKDELDFCRYWVSLPEDIQQLAFFDFVAKRRGQSPVQLSFAFH